MSAYSAPACYIAGIIYTRKSATAFERQTADTRNAATDSNARKSATSRERQTADTRHTVGNNHARKSFTVGERTINRHRDFSFFLDSGAAFIVTPLL